MCLEASEMKTRTALNNPFCDQREELADIKRRLLRIYEMLLISGESESDRKRAMRYNEGKCHVEGTETISNLGRPPRPGKMGPWRKNPEKGCSYEHDQMWIQHDLRTSAFVPVHKWKIEKFNGAAKNFSRFLSRVQLFMKSQRATPKDLFENRVFLFESDAADWVANSKAKNWEELIEYINLCLFGIDSDGEKRRRLEKLRQGTECVAIFVNRFLMDCNSLTVPLREEEKIRFLLFALRPEISAILAVNSNWRSVEEFMKSAIVIEKLAMRRNGLLEVEAMEVKAVKPTSVKRFMKRPLTLCYRCGHIGHLSTNCENDAKIVCFGCGKVGVRRSECSRCFAQNRASGTLNGNILSILGTEKTGGIRDKKGKIAVMEAALVRNSIQQGLASENQRLRPILTDDYVFPFSGELVGSVTARERRPIKRKLSQESPGAKLSCDARDTLDNEGTFRPKVDVWIKERRVRGLLDSGASISVMTEALCRQMKLHIEYGSDSTVTVANRSKLSAVGKVGIKVGFNGEMAHLDFIVVKKSLCPMILGINFWAEFKLGISSIDSGTISIWKPGEALSSKFS